MKEQYQIWCYLHDGFITEIQDISSDLLVKVEIPYLRKMFLEPGDSFLIMLRNCTKFDYSIWDDVKNTVITTDNLPVIQTIKPEIIAVVQKDDIAKVECNEGELHLKYDGLSIRLDTGKSIAISDIHKACNKYWSDLSIRSKNQKSIIGFIRRLYKKLHNADKIVDKQRLLRHIDIINTFLPAFRIFVIKNNFKEIDRENASVLLGDWYLDLQSEFIKIRFVRDRGNIRLVKIKSSVERDWHQLEEVIEFIDNGCNKEYFGSPPNIEKIAKELEDKFTVIKKIFAAEENLEQLRIFENKRRKGPES